MNIQIIMAPFIGGLIGLITNSLAIKMLFRPYKEIKIAGLHIPFTPGLIPKEKTRIAHAISKVIANYILDEDTILASLASEDVYQAYIKKYEEKIAEWKKLDIACSEMLENYGFIHSVNVAETRLKDSISNYLIEQCRQEEAARKMIDAAFGQFQENLNPLIYKVGKKAMNSAKESMAEQAEKLLEERGKEVIGQYIDKIYIGWLDKPVSEIVCLVEQEAPNMEQMIWETYKAAIKGHASQFLSTLNIQKIIENKINEYDLGELEDMIMEISKKELNAVVWLGGLLGILMGFVNLIF